jgi:hypothetical protein
MYPHRPLLWKDRDCQTTVALSCQWQWAKLPTLAQSRPKSSHRRVQRNGCRALSPICPWCTVYRKHSPRMRRSSFLVVMSRELRPLVVLVRHVRPEILRSMLSSAHWHIQKRQIQCVTKPPSILGFPFSNVQCEKKRNLVYSHFGAKFVGVCCIFGRLMQLYHGWALPSRELAKNLSTLQISAISTSK